MLIARALLVVSLAALSGCLEHPVVTTDGPFIDNRGISVPVPPPSFWDVPKQFVDIEGNLNIGTPDDNTKVFLFEATTERGYFVYAQDNGDFLFTGVEVDLTDNCLELWYEEPGPYGQSSVHSFFRAIISEDGTEIETEQLMAGC